MRHSFSTTVVVAALTSACAGPSADTATKPLDSLMVFVADDASPSRTVRPLRLSTDYRLVPVGNTFELPSGTSLRGSVGGRYLVHGGGRQLTFSSVTEDGGLEVLVTWECGASGSFFGCGEVFDTGSGSTPAILIMRIYGLRTGTNDSLVTVEFDAAHRALRRIGPLAGADDLGNAGWRPGSDWVFVSFSRSLAAYRGLRSGNITSLGSILDATNPSFAVHPHLDVVYVSENSRNFAPVTELRALRVDPDRYLPVVLDTYRLPTPEPTSRRLISDPEGRFLLTYGSKLLSLFALDGSGRMSLVDEVAESPIAGVWQDASGTLILVLRSNERNTLYGYRRMGSRLEPLGSLYTSPRPITTLQFVGGSTTQ